MNDKYILDKTKKLDFYHRVKLTDNITTLRINRKQIKKNIDQTRKLDLKNKKVLNIGCRDSICSFDPEKMETTEAIADGDISKSAVEFLIPFFNSKGQMNEKNLKYVYEVISQKTLDCVSSFNLVKKNYVVHGDIQKHLKYDQVN